ncbi:MAG: hypothetical protein N838_09750 [Thiohalocapsa sp. PB-PSB1]|nr:MAG: hypothetical protein N838_09750 [Thiohalocapsa sp. PB-PSB1]
MRMGLLLTGRACVGAQPSSRRMDVSNIGVDMGLHISVFPAASWLDMDSGDGESAMEARTALVHAEDSAGSRMALSQCGPM